MLVNGLGVVCSQSMRRQLKFSFLTFPCYVLWSVFKIEALPGIKKYMETDGYIKHGPSTLARALWGNKAVT